jgi:hypothetical protein
MKKMDEKMDERIKWMKKMKKQRTKHVYNQELCVNPNTSSSQPRNMCQPEYHLLISKRYVPIRN